MTWARVRIGDVCASVKKMDPVQTGRPSVRYVDIGGIDGSRHVLGDVPWVEASRAPSRCRQVLRGGDTVFSTVRPYLEKIAYIDAGLEGEFASTGFCVLRPESEIVDPRFMFHYVTSHAMLDQVLPSQKGVSYPAVLDRQVKAASILLPSLQEQHRIVAILEEHLTGLDSATRTLVSALNRLSALRALCLEGLSPSSVPHATLAAVSISAGYGTSAKCVRNGLGLPVVRIPNLSDGRVDLTDEKRCQDPRVELEGFVLNEGDLLIVRTNGSKDLIGRAAVVQAGISAAFASYLIRFRLDERAVVPEWVRLMLERPTARVALEGAAASSAGQYNLSLGKLNPLEIPVPSIAVQRRLLAEYDTRATDLSRLKATGETAIARNATLRRSLLSAAFSGRLTGRSSDDAIIDELAGAAIV